MIACNKRKMTWTEAEMLIARKQMWSDRNKHKERKEVRYYFCDECRAYHLTKSDWYYTSKDYGKK